MSTQTAEALENAIREHFMSELGEPAILTDWCVLSAMQGLNDATTTYVFTVPQGMAPHQLTGLIAHYSDKFRLQYAGTR